MKTRSKPVATACKSHMHNNFWGWLFAFPAVFGLVCLLLFPLVYSFILSFFEWDIISEPVFVGFGNYIHLFTEEVHFWNSLWVTVKYTLIFIPSMLVVTFLLANLMNAKGVWGKGLWRIAVYVPSVVPVIASAMLWTFIYDPYNGILNNLLKPFGINPEWLHDKNLVLPALALMGIWGAGNTVIVNLSSLGSISQDLYDAVSIDGGNAFRRFWHITIPMMTPVIFYNLVMSVVGTLQTFTQAFVMTGGGPENASNFYMLYLYNNVFNYNRMGLGAAMSWILFAVVGLFTIFFFKTSGWVYYGGDGNE